MGKNTRILRPWMIGPRLHAPTGLLRGDENPFARDYQESQVYRIRLGKPAKQKAKVGTPGEPRRCRFCLGVRPDVNFSKEAHVVPQGLGNRELVSVDECDECNETAGETLEDHLLKYLSPVRAVLPLLTKKGGKAKHKVRQAEDASYIESRAGGDPGVVFFANAADPNLTIERDENARLVRYHVRKQPVRMLDMAKALARMAYMLLPPEDLARFDYIRRWIRGEVDHWPVMHEVRIPGTGLNEIRLVLYTQRQPLVGRPPLVVALGFGTVVLFLHLPTEALKTPDVVDLPTFGTSPFPPYYPTSTKITILSDVIDPASTVTMSMQYEGATAGEVDHDELERMLGFKIKKPKPPKDASDATVYEPTRTGDVASPTDHGVPAPAEDDNG